jgi:putative IMPACT (imprinted ancient) family translation regulator
LDTCCIVTRYFGGILLGAPGLVRAYGAAAARALDAAGSRTVVRAHLYRWTVPYESYGATARFLQAFPEAVVKDADFGAEVQVTFTVAAAQAERLRREAGRLLQAQPRLVLVGETFV